MIFDQVGHELNLVVSDCDICGRTLNGWGFGQDRLGNEIGGGYGVADVSVKAT